MSNKFLALLVLACIFVSSPWPMVFAADCEKKDLKYVYTECQAKENTRWRVQVPNATCQAKTVEFPVPGQKCDVVCSSGQFLDVDKNGCAKCPAGTYSLGSGVRFDMWKSLPEGFIVSADKFDTTTGGGACPEVGWKPMGDYLTGRPDNNCQLSLTYTANLATDGEVVFYYQYHGEAAFFTFEVQNGLCESVNREENSSPLMDETDRNEIRMHRVKLKMGMNVLRWQVLPVVEGVASSPSTSSRAGGEDYPIVIHSVQITGIPYVYQCQPCHNGFTSSAGQAKCTKCAADTYSTNGETCQPCPAGQYAPAGSDACSPRPPCRAGDYELATGAQPCSAAGGFKLAPAYDWIRPKVCDGGVPLPAASAAPAPASCQAYCNPGMRASGADPLACQACPEGHFSGDTAGQCQPCPSNTQVVHEYVASNWMVTPPLMNLSCVVLLEDSVVPCTEPGWYLMGDRVQTAATRLPRHSRVLTLDLPGFHALPGADTGSGAAISNAGATDDDESTTTTAAGRDVGVLTIDFELACDSPCQLFLLKLESHRHTEIKSWVGKQSRMTFKYIIRRTDRHKFYLIFEPAPLADATDGTAAKKPIDWLGNRLTVYSVRATNALASGGVRCQACPLGIKGQKCIPCPAGKYYDAKNATCYFCPAGTVVAKRPAEGLASCQPCEAGMRSVGGVACEIDPKPKRPLSEGGREFDFTDLVGGYRLAEGGKQFTGRGSQYMHLYNVSLSSRAKARCVSNATGLGESLTVESFVCRITVVPNHRNASLTLAALPTSFGDRLVNATTSGRSPVAEAMMVASGWAADPDGMDTHVFFETDYTTRVCQQRRVTLVTLRCDPKAAVPQLSLPPKCPDGTCDGCNFHLLLTAKQACQLCRTPDYERVKGECVLGKQTVHLFPPKRCYLPEGGEPVKKIEVVDCPLVNKPVAIVMLVIVAIGAVSLGVALHCYRKNRSLQYKYMQLVESKEGELPGVESCAVHEGEGEDDDDEYGDAEVSVRRGGGGGGSGGALSKLRRSILPSGGPKRGGRGRSGGGVEHLNLTEQMDDLSL